MLKGLMHLVGFIIRMFHDARSPKRQTPLSVKVLNMTNIFTKKKKKRVRSPENDNGDLLGHYAACSTQKSAVLLCLAEGSMKSRSKEKEITVPLLRSVRTPFICKKGNVILQHKDFGNNRTCQ